MQWIKGQREAFVNLETRIEIKSILENLICCLQLNIFFNHIFLDENRSIEIENRQSFPMVQREKIRLILTIILGIKNWIEDPQKFLRVQKSFQMKVWTLLIPQIFVDPKGISNWKYGLWWLSCFNTFTDQCLAGGKRPVPLPRGTGQWMYWNKKGLEPCPCFPNFLARTTFVLVSLWETKIPGQDAIFGDFVLNSCNRKEEERRSMKHLQKPKNSWVLSG